MRTISTLKKLIFILLIFSINHLTAQDPVLSQFYSSPLLLNPAFAGNTQSARFALNYRNQWPGLAQAYRTYAISYDQFFEDYNSGVGISLLTDDAGRGLYKTTKFGAVYSYRLQISKNTFIKTGMELAGVQAGIGWDKLLFPDQLDPLYGEVGPGGSPIPSLELRPDQISKVYLDLAMGTMIYSPYFYGGISLNHINNPDTRFIKISDNTSNSLPLRYTIHGGSQINIFDGKPGRSSIFISPNFMYTHQSNFTELLGGAYFGLGSLFAGVWARLTPHNPDAAIISVGLRTGKMKISYSYDATISRLSYRSGGAHEIGIVYNLDDQNGRKGLDYNDCFQLFR
ncbi:MAG: PorP/SprF family type IX secretion system membrane protein [Saprospiraceae bacterium]